MYNSLIRTLSLGLRRIGSKNCQLPTTGFRKKFILCFLKPPNAFFLDTNDGELFHILVILKNKTKNGFRILSHFRQFFTTFFPDVFSISVCGLTIIANVNEENSSSPRTFCGKTLFSNCLKNLSFSFNGKLSFLHFWDALQNFKNQINFSAFFLFFLLIEHLDDSLLACLDFLTDSLYDESKSEPFSYISASLLPFLH